MKRLIIICILLVGCGHTPPPKIITAPDIIELPEPVRVTVPEILLQPCPIARLPIYGDKWEDTLDYIAQKHVQQQICNCRFDLIRQWQEGLIEENQLTGEGCELLSGEP